MTTLEQQTLALFKSVCAQQLSDKEKWEQRRFELASKLFLEHHDRVLPRETDALIEKVFNTTDNFIKQFKKRYGD